MPDELIDIVTEEGFFTGDTRMKSEAHRLGLYHNSVHIWLYDQRGNILIQKRAHNKDTYPNLWDVSVAGHIGAGESPKNAALREVQEEIGLCLQASNLEFIGKYLAKKEPSVNIIDNEFHYIYIAILTKPIADLKVQKEEVSAIKLISTESLQEDIEHEIRKKEYVPHDPDYYELILKEIKNRFS
ncbi:NUDIX hydrolase [Aquimarina litoralis]|uniref:NUDIX hydrolase n=1 Tax=Aquimarina litoralis TaxID=584605 RepID=UPI001C58618D|nr:NUDIX domain-containing protein [Aquimarina litoralis]MBW1298371.1 NUDIX domain-containing protein [Aquimarina litoralis]